MNRDALLFVPLSLLAAGLLACSTAQTSPSAQTGAQTPSAPLAEADPEGEDLPPAGPWTADPVLGSSGGVELRAGLVLDKTGVQLYLHDGTRLLGPVAVSEPPPCEPYEAGGSVKHSLDTKDETQRVSFDWTCTPFDAEGREGMANTHEESCELAFEPGLPARWVVECASYYEGGAHPDHAIVRHRYAATDLSPLPRCANSEDHLAPQRRSLVHDAMRAAGCPADEYEDYLSCSYRLPRPDGGTTWLLEFYLPRADRANDCDQLELLVEEPTRSG